MKHERELSRLPVPPCPAVELPEDKKGYPAKRYLPFSAQLERGFEDGDVLGVTIYDRSGKPLARWWLNDETSVMQALAPAAGYKKREPGKLYESSIDTEFNVKGYWCSHQTELVGTEADQRTVRRFLGNTRGRNVGEAIADYQDAQRAKKRVAVQEKRREQIRARFETLPAVSPFFDTWIEEDALLDGRWFLYEYTGKRAQEGVCTHCEKESLLEGLRNGATAVCPHCGSTLHCRTWKRIGRGGLDERDRVAIYQRAEDRIAVRVYTVGVNVDVDTLLHRIKKKVWSCEDYRYFCTLDGKVTPEAYSRQYGQYSVEVDGFRPCSNGYGYTKVLACPLNLYKLRTDMGLRTPLEELAGRRLRCIPERLFQTAREKPELEYLVKLGLYRLAAWEMTVDSWQRSTALLPGKTAAEKLGVDGNALQGLRQADVNGEELKLIRNLLSHGVKVRPEDMEDIRRLRLRGDKAEALLHMTQDLSLHKALRYVGQQMSAQTDAEHVLQLWRDYIGMAAELGIDLRNGMRRFPKKLKRAHDEAVKLVGIRRDHELDRRIAQTADALADLVWQTKTLTIFPARSQGELFTEGKLLDHCVGRAGYADSMAHGWTAIFFIRKTETPDEPYVTLELDLKTWKKRQCYGKGDTWPGKAVDNFVSRWIKDVVRPARVQKKEEKTA